MTDPLRRAIREPLPSVVREGLENSVPDSSLGQHERGGSRKVVAKQLVDGRLTKKGLAKKTLLTPCLVWRPQGDSNPCCRRERAVS